MYPEMAKVVDTPTRRKCRAAGLLLACPATRASPCSDYWGVLGGWHAQASWQGASSLGHAHGFAWDPPSAHCVPFAVCRGLLEVGATADRGSGDSCVHGCCRLSLRARRGFGRGMELIGPHHPQMPIVGK